MTCGLLGPLWVFCVFGVFLHSGLPCDSDGKESTYNAGDPGSISGSGRSPGEGNGNPLQYSSLENSRDRGAWQATVLGSGYSPQGHKESDMTLFFHMFSYTLCHVFETQSPGGTCQPFILVCGSTTFHRVWTTSICPFSPGWPLGLFLSFACCE